MQPRPLRFLLPLALAAPFTARAQQPDPRSALLDSAVRMEMQRQRIPGLSVAVVIDGVVIKAAGYGMADRERSIPATPETVYRIASVSKQFIAAGIMLLTQEGRLRLDDPVTRYLDGAPSAWRGITIRHLLTHTSGLVREGPAFDPGKVQSDQAVIASAYRLPLRFAPGDRYEYGNLEYFVLGEIIARVSGHPWPDYLDARIFRRLGMAATYPTNTTAPVMHRAQGYVDNDNLRKAPEWVALRPSGAFLSTVLDLAKWDAALYGGEILADSTREAMWAPVTLTDGSTYPYGFGWQLDPLLGHRAVAHRGGMPGARAAFARFLDDRLTIILLMNLDDVDIDAILNAVARIYLPRQGH